jgi:hypothetical protein
VDRFADGTGVIGIERRPGVTMLEFTSPILSLDVLDGFSSALQALAADREHDPLVLCSAHPSVLLAIAGAVLLGTRQLDPLTLSNHGAVLSVAEDPIAAATETARRMASLDPARWRLWRTLRGPGFIDRFHAFVVHKL